MFNNIKEEIEKDLNKEKNYEAILSKVEGVSKMKNKVLKIAIYSACIVIIAIIGVKSIYIFNPNKEDVEDNKWEKREIYYNSSEETEIQDAVELHWEELTDAQRYYKLEINNINLEYETSVTEISKEKLGEYIGIGIVKGTDTYTEEEHIINAKVYKILNVSEKCAVAVQFENSSDYYIYINSNYRPETLGEFIKDLNLKDTLKFSTKARYTPIKDGKVEKEIEFEGIKSDIIWKMLFSDVSAKILQNESEYHETLVNISITNPLSKFDRYAVTLTKDGYLYTNILETGKTFYIGEEKVNDFVNYLIENCKGYEIVYVDTNPDIDKEETKGNSNIIMYDVVNNVTTEVEMNSIKQNANFTNTNSIKAFMGNGVY